MTLWRGRKSSSSGFIVLIFLSYNFGLWGQSTTPNPEIARDSLPFNIKELIDIDSFKVKWRPISKPTQTSEISDTSGFSYYHHYDPARRRPFDLLHLGVPGSAARNARWDYLLQDGNRPVLEGFQSYRWADQSPRTYLAETAFSKLLFLRGSDQDDYFFEANLGLRLADSTWFSLDYERLPQIGDYRAQRLRNTSARFVLDRSWWRDKMQTIAYFQAYEMIQENNGGITTDTLLLQPIFQQRANYPVFLDNSQSSLKDRHWGISNKLKEIGLWGTSVYIEHIMRWEQSQFKFYDATIPSENLSTYFRDYYSLYQKGIRQAWQYNRLQQDLRAGNSFTFDNKKWVVDWQLGAKYVRARWKPNDSFINLNEGYVYGFGNIRYGNTWTGKLNYQFGMGDAARSYTGNAEANWSPNKYFYLRATASSSRLMPNLLARDLFINFSPAYADQNWQLPQFQKVSLALGSATLGSYLEGARQWVNQWMYFNAEGKPTQLSNQLSLWQWSAVQKLSWSVWHMDQSIIWQTGATASLGAIPLFYKNSTYYEGGLLSKSSKLRVGVDFRYILPGASWTYFPLHGQFIQLDTANMKSYYEADVFAALKVKVFQAFFRFENLFNAITGQTGWIHPGYPLQDAGIRLGIQWVFIN